MSNQVLAVTDREIERREQAVVRSLQSRFAPSEYYTPSVGPIAVRRVPGPGLGRDLFQAASGPGARMTIAMGSVSGKGLAVGLATAVLAGELVDLVLNGATPRLIVDQLDGSLRHINDELKHKTLICSLFCVDVNQESGRAVYNLAGDIDAFLVNAGGSIKHLERCQDSLGRGERSSAIPLDFDFEDGARIIACSSAGETSRTAVRSGIIDVLKRDMEARRRRTNPDALADAMLQGLRADDRSPSMAAATLVVADIGIMERTKATVDVDPWWHRCARLNECAPDASVFLG